VYLGSGDFSALGLSSTLSFVCSLVNCIGAEVKHLSEVKFNMEVSNFLKELFIDKEQNEIATIYVECNYHSAILANGILSESYLEIGNNRKLFENTKNK
jgi:hypothetical protein